MRLFLAIELSERIRANAGALQERLATANADVRWVAPENFHLTVMFLGELSEALLPDIDSACQTICLETKPFRVRAGGGSYFPRKAPIPKTLWVGVSEGAEEWRALARRCEPWFVPMGAARDGGLIPHITLGRVKGSKNIDALKAVLTQEAGTDCGDQNAEGMTLIESVLSAEGASYRKRGFWHFTENSVELSNHVSVDAA